MTCEKGVGAEALRIRRMPLTSTITSFTSLQVQSLIIVLSFEALTHCGGPVRGLGSHDRPIRISVQREHLRALKASFLVFQADSNVRPDPLKSLLGLGFSRLSLVC